MGGSSCFSKATADVFPSWHGVNTQLYAQEEKFCFYSEDHTQILNSVFYFQKLESTYPL